MLAATFRNGGKAAALTLICILHQIVAIGRNYSEHAKELNNAVPKEPIIFLKPTTSYVASGGNVEIPNGILAHYEVELGVVVSKRGRDIPESQAQSYVAGYALAVDMTARNLQEEIKAKRLPWTVAKGFDSFTPISSYIPKESVSDATNLSLTLKVNGAVKQDGNTKDMIFSIPKLIEHVSTIMTLEVCRPGIVPCGLLTSSSQEGDLILTGTPSGVGPVVPGDKVEEQLASLDFAAVQREGGYHYKPEPAQ
ncbi:hypothetical protein LXA43DRAFT_1025677 [Ganoderma leucocontextum]|nr:hypothetical protein LXA43DRAFT_1025677 [Ganoderma leucocontextum]